MSKAGLATSSDFPRLISKNVNFAMSSSYKIFRCCALAEEALRRTLEYRCLKSGRFSPFTGESTILRIYS